MKPRQPKVAVVILNWNGTAFLEKFLPSVLAATTYPNCSIYVADNGSTDGSIAFVQKHFPSVQIIDNQENYGFAKGYNVALATIKDADYFVLLNSDVEVTANWIEPIIWLMERDALIAACQPKIRAYWQKTHFEYAGAAGGWIDYFGYVFCRGRFFDVCEEDKGQYDRMSEVFWATGAALFVKASLYRQIGGLDDDFFAHMEEIDLCWRLKRAGYAVVYCPKSLVYHWGGGSLPQGSPRKTYLNFRNNLIMLFKNFSRLQLLFILPIRLLLDIIAAVKSVLSGNTMEAKAILKAQWHFLKDLPKWYHKRQEDKQLVELVRYPQARSNLTGIYPHSIIVDYFLRGKRYFHELF